MVHAVYAMFIRCLYIQLCDSHLLGSEADEQQNVVVTVDKAPFILQARLLLLLPTKGT